MGWGGLLTPVDAAMLVAGGVLGAVVVVGVAVGTRRRLHGGGRRGVVGHNAFNG